MAGHDGIFTTEDGDILKIYSLDAELEAIERILGRLSDSVFEFDPNKIIDLHACIAAWEPLGSHKRMRLAILHTIFGLFPREKRSCTDMMRQLLAIMQRFFTEYPDLVNACIMDRQQVAHPLILEPLERGLRLVILAMIRHGAKVSVPCSLRKIDEVNFNVIPRLDKFESLEKSKPGSLYPLAALVTETIGSLAMMDDILTYLDKTILVTALSTKAKTKLRESATKIQNLDQEKILPEGRERRAFAILDRFQREFEFAETLGAATLPLGLLFSSNSTRGVGSIVRRFKDLDGDHAIYRRVLSFLGYKQTGNLNLQFVRFVPSTYGVREHKTLTDVTKCRSSVRRLSI